MWRHQGLTFYSPFPLGEPAPVGTPVDVCVQVEDPRALGTGRPGEVVAHLEARGKTFYTVYEVPGGFLARFHEVADFEVSGDGGSVVCRPGPDCAADLVQVLVVGTITALLLTLRGYAVVHGSAIRWQGEAVLFAGYSGQGKTTLAALCCAAGAELVSDDVVALVQVEKGMACFGLAHELRLREAAWEIADLFPPPGPARRSTADGRLALSPAVAPAEVNAISAVLLPVPVRGAFEPSVLPLAPPVALVKLLGNARVPAMVPISLQKPYFAAVSDLVTAAPVVEARVPWGPPFTTGFVPALLERACQVVARPRTGGHKGLDSLF